MRFRTLAAASIALAAFAVRAGYLRNEISPDTALGRPVLDGAVYVDWARALATGGDGPSGPYYLAPLYPFLLAGTFRALGENLVVVYLLQHLAILGTAALLAVVSRRVAGELAALTTATLVLAYHPFLFFASRPMGESVAILLLAAALASHARAPAAAGFGAGLAALGRPNLLLVPVVWMVRLARERRGRPLALLCGGLAVAVLPVAARNSWVAGRPVGISTNGGLTLYHGNGPGARGIYTPPVGFSGDPATQREEAIDLARFESGRALDPVEADRWWGRKAIATRLADPWGTCVLVARRGMLLLDDHEHGLDYAPSLDENPWRRGAPVRFAVFLGLAVAGVVLAGFSGTGGWTVWGAIAAAAATPIVFFVSSRYRLPLVALLAIPAGAGVAGLVGATASRPRRAAASAAGFVIAAISILVPSGDLVRAGEAVALSNRAIARERGGDLPGAERDASDAVARDPSSAVAWFNLGTILERLGRAEEAEVSYRRALASDPGQAEAAGNLARILVVRGRAAEAVPILRRALASRPGHAVCWTNLVLALAATGDAASARDALAEAMRAGAKLDPELAATFGSSGTER